MGESGMTKNARIGEFIATDGQAFIWRDFGSNAEDKAREAWQRAREAFDAIKVLPYLNHERELVQNGSNVAMTQIVDHYVTIARLWESHLSSEVVDKIHKEFKFTNGRFVK
jgi:hypothetical protein